jgi:hypothetical protein
MDILNQIECKNRAFDVIDSCITISHVLSARNYIKLYFEKFEDMLGYMELESQLEDKLSLISRKEQSNGKE